MRLYRSKEHPDHWIGEDEHGAIMIWPARPRGWSKRTGYAGSRRQLEEIEPVFARGSGWPGGACERAASARDRGLSDWIRDTCNAAAAGDARPRAKGRRARAAP